MQKKKKKKKKNRNRRQGVAKKQTSKTDFLIKIGKKNEKNIIKATASRKLKSIKGPAFASPSTQNFSIFKKEL